VYLRCTRRFEDNGARVFNCKHKPVVELFGLPDPPKTGRGRLVHAAIELVYGHGFQAVGVDQVFIIELSMPHPVTEPHHELEQLNEPP